MQKDIPLFETYPLELFNMLKDFFAQITSMYHNPGYQFPDNILGDYCRSHPREINLQEIRSNTSNEESFKKRFFRTLDAFRILKFLNYAVGNGYLLVPVTEQALLLTGAGPGDDVLEMLRRADRINRAF